MMYKATILVGSKLEAADGELGTVKDFLFDDATWKIRYLVVETGSWLASRSVLLAPSSIANFSEVNRVLTTSLSRTQVETSPDVDRHVPMSREDEMSLHSYYGWAPYWESAAFVWPSAYSFPEPSSVEASLLAIGAGEPLDEDLRLGSFEELRTFGLHATDGDLGRVADLFFDADRWQITHVVADARTWWPGATVVIDASFIDDVLWDDDKVAVRLTKEQVKNSPPYEANSPFSEDYLLGLSGYYTALARTPDRSLGKADDWRSPPSGE